MNVHNPATAERLLSVDEALAAILARIPVLPAEPVLLDDALGRVLAEDVHADMAVPPFDNSAMDGYALIAADTEGATRERPAVLRVVADLPAGQVPDTPVRRGEAIRIMTGAPMPPGADAIVRVEDTERGEGTVRVRIAARPGRDVRFAGEDVRAGDLILPRGSYVRPAEVGMLAMLGRRHVQVVRRPRVAVLTTGDELVDVDEPVTPGKIRNVNLYSIMAQVRWCGGEPISLGVARDTVAELEAKVREGMTADLLVTSAGVSVGDYDVVKVVLDKLGHIDFWRVNMKPARPLAFGHLGSVPMFGLPGNPAASMVAFEEFVRPAILKMQGRQALRHATLQAVSDAALDNRGGRRSFVRGYLYRDGDGYRVRPAGPEGAGIMTAMVRANCFIVIPEDVARVAPGDTIGVELLDAPAAEAPAAAPLAASASGAEDCCD
ncbi:MAG TPA: gephyrin-like molybdotransferase Glp [Chloroflexota bacterium]|nr:gephyrin-like molybdotransferase Glp [Chloroflexota bacterium]